MQHSFKKNMMLTSLLIILWGLTACGGEPNNEPQVMTVKGPGPDGAEVTEPGVVGSVAGSVYDSTIGRLFPDGLYSSVFVGRYLDIEPAERMAGNLRNQGLTAFVLKRRLEEKGTVFKTDLGEFYLVLAGLFGEKADAETLGQRLKAEGLVRSYQVVPVDHPGEIESTTAQTQGQSLKSAKLSDQVKQTAGRPLGPESSAASGEAFKKNVYGQYVGSYRDPWRAQAEAEALTRAGWQASVESEGTGGSMWHRVYLSPTEDHRDWKADGQTLASAKHSAATQPGIVVLADMSSLKGYIGQVGPSASRSDASACAGFSEAGRLNTTILRTIIYIPDTSYIAALVPIVKKPLETYRDVPSRIKAWWNDEGSRPTKKAIYGPSIFYRPEMEAAVSRLVADPDKASLAMGLTETANDLMAIPGRKVLLVFSEFMGDDQPQTVRDALGRLRMEFGSNLEVIFVYGDTNAAGYALANDLAREAGTGQAWNGCLLLNNNAYFERYIKTIFR
ncbi:hypothetical protein C4J81_03295 [Deltaproteobacteria bacterium Smac51]|nr:hypothetical protein C4J81_03295 [Deltaproteobacteria bacterium Smac51]